MSSISSFPGADPDGMGELGDSERKAFVVRVHFGCLYPVIMAPVVDLGSFVLGL